MDHIKDEPPKVVILEMVNYDKYRISCHGEWVDIDKGTFGFADLLRVFPVLEGIYTTVCACQLNE